MLVAEVGGAASSSTEGKKGRRNEVRQREVRHMEGLFLQSVPGMGSLVAGLVLLAIVIAAVAYGWTREERSRATTEHEPLKKAA
jgi:hypothetical protein